MKINIFHHWIDHGEISNQLKRIIERQEQLFKELKKMATKAELDQAIVDLKAAIATETSEITQKISDLEAKIAAGQDVTQEVADIREAIASIQGIVTPDQPPTP